jgi:peptidyl-Lys metalloendopeptidase
LSKEGSQAGFIGAKVKYGFGAATRFVSLEPGAAVDVTHNRKAVFFLPYCLVTLFLTLLLYHLVAAAYNFTNAGDYEIEASNLFHYVDNSGNVVPIQADIASTHTAKLDGNLVSSIVSKRSMEHSLVKRASFKSCSSTQSSQINTALTTTTTYVNNAVSYLTSLSATSTRYSTWFGTC